MSTFDVTQKESFKEFRSDAERPKETRIDLGHDPGEGKRLKFICDFYQLSPPLHKDVYVALYVKGHKRAVMWGYQINSVNGY